MISFGDAMAWSDAPDFDEIAEHMLAIIDVWNRPEMGASATCRRFDAVTTMVKTCFGRHQAEAITLELLFDFDRFDERLNEDRCEPDQYERRILLARLLRSEFERPGGRYMITE